MHLSPYMLYAIFMLDNVRGLFTGVAAFGGIATLVCFLVGAMAGNIGSRQRDEEKAIWEAGKKYGFRFFVAATVAFTITTFMPSSKQMAAIVVLPAVVNNPNVQKEAGDLYKLAKQGLSKLVKDDDKPQETTSP